MINKQPVHIRRNVEDYNDPYIEEESLKENTKCKSCGSVFTSGRWYAKGQLPEKKTSNGEMSETTCPACRKQQDKMPSGVLKMSGEFIVQHKEEIMNLIHNETGKAQSINPLERIMSITSEGKEIEITTTNEKLAQKIGKALHKAYSGHIDYKWSGDTKLARVNWSREI